FRRKAGLPVSKRDYLDRFPGLGGAAAPHSALKEGDADLPSTVGYRFADASLEELFNDNASKEGDEGLRSLPRRDERYPLVDPTESPRKGGIGQVWRVKDTQLGRIVALKELQHQTAHHPGARRRFFAEAKITSQLGHPNIVPVHELIGQEDAPSS